MGFYAPPAIEISEVVRPRTPKKWADVTVATADFGHGIAVTPLQFLDAAGGLVGDGTRVPITLLEREPDAPLQHTRYVSAHTAELMRWLMWLVVEQGTGTKAKLASYEIGGKTGTAEKPAGAATARTVSWPRSSAPSRSIVPATWCSPRSTSRRVMPARMAFATGGWIAAPVVAQIIDRIGPILGVPRSLPEVAQELRDRPGTPQSSRAPGQEASLALGSALR